MSYPVYYHSPTGNSPPTSLLPYNPPRGPQLVPYNAPTQEYRGQWLPNPVPTPGYHQQLMSPQETSFLQNFGVQSFTFGLETTLSMLLQGSTACTTAERRILITTAERSANDYLKQRISLAETDIRTMNQVMKLNSDYAHTLLKNAKDDSEEDWDSEEEDECDAKEDDDGSVANDSCSKARLDMTLMKKDPNGLPVPGRPELIPYLLHGRHNEQPLPAFKDKEGDCYYIPETRQWYDSNGKVIIEDDPVEEQARPRNMTTRETTPKPTPSTSKQLAIRSTASRAPKRGRKRSLEIPQEASTPTTKKRITKFRPLVQTSDRCLNSEKMLERLFEFRDELKEDPDALTVTDSGKMCKYTSTTEDEVDAYIEKITKLVNEDTPLWLVHENAYSDDHFRVGIYKFTREKLMVVLHARIEGEEDEEAPSSVSQLGVAILEKNQRFYDEAANRDFSRWKHFLVDGTQKAFVENKARKTKKRDANSYMTLADLCPKKYHSGMTPNRARCSNKNKSDSE